MSKHVEFKHISLYEMPEESAGYLLWRVSTQWRSTIEHVLKPLDLTHPQFVVLATLGWLTRKGDIVNQVEVGKIAGLDPNTTSQILRGLEAKNFIKRTQSIDERSKNPILTTMGSKVLTQALPAVEQADMKFFEPLQGEESKKLIKLFQHLMSQKL